MGLKHGKYVYVERKDGFYVKVRVLNIRFKKSGKKERYSFDINDVSKYIVLPVKTRARPLKAEIVKVDDLPKPVAEAVNRV